MHIRAIQRKRMSSELVLSTQQVNRPSPGATKVSAIRNQCELASAERVEGVGELEGLAVTT